MRIYRPSYSKTLSPGERIRKDKHGQFVWLTDRQGQRKKCRVTGDRMKVPSSFYTIVFRDHLGSERRLQGHRDKSSTDLLAQTVAKIVYHRQRGETLPAELHEWGDKLPDATHKTLASFGLLRARRAVVSQALEELLKLFEQHLSIKKQRNARYVFEVMSKLRKMFGGCGFERLGDIDDVVLDTYLTGLRKSEKLSTRTLNHYLKTVQQFCRYCVRTLRAMKTNPLESLEGFGNANADRRRERRALTRDEINKLLTTTTLSKEVRYGMDGQERALVYRFALQTGLRLNEIRTLRVEHFDFDGPEGPVAMIEASYSKHRERDLLPIRADLADTLKAFIADRQKMPTAKLFGGAFQQLTDKAAPMIRADLKDADVPYQTVTGVCDFHALRHTFVSSLKGIAARTAQGLARHKSSDMTDRYTHMNLAEQRAALDSLDSFGLAS